MVRACCVRHSAGLGRDLRHKPWVEGSQKLEAMTEKYF